MQSALRDRDLAIVPIFRERFRSDGLQKRLFNGDPSLVTSLKLQQHCDSVLIGVLRFVGPAQLVDGGFFIREAVLDVHAIDPVTGRVKESLEISEKGGGASAELSTVNAIARLKEKVEASISEWSWV
jgi:hypothetical protein